MKTEVTKYHFHIYLCYRRQGPIISDCQALLSYQLVKVVSSEMREREISWGSQISRYQLDCPSRAICGLQSYLLFWAASKPASRNGLSCEIAFLASSTLLSAISGWLSKIKQTHSISAERFSQFLTPLPFPLYPIVWMMSRKSFWWKLTRAKTKLGRTLENNFILIISVLALIESTMLGNPRTS